MIVLEKIRADLEHWKSDGVHDDFESGALYMRDYALMVIDKYASEECDNDCEHCAYIECPKEPCEDAVSRQAVMNIVKKWYPYRSEIEELEALPSVGFCSNISKVSKEELDRINANIKEQQERAYKCIKQSRQEQIESLKKELNETKVV